MNAIVSNPYHYAGAVIARISVNAATIIWSLVGLYNDGALLPMPYGPMMLRYGPEKSYALFFLVLSSILLYRIAFKIKPHWIGAIAYGIIGVAWLYVDVSLWFYIRPMQGFVLGWVTVGTVLAAYAFLAKPRAHNVATG